MSSEFPCPRTTEKATVFGMPHADMMPSKYIGRGGPNRLRFADLSGTRRETNRFTRVRNEALIDLMQYGIEAKKNTNKDISKPIGSGRYAEVYAINGKPDKVMKISGDRTEAVAWARVFQAVEDGEISWELLPSLAKVHCVYMVRSTRKADQDLYVIIMDKYKPLMNVDKSLVDCIDRNILVGEGALGGCVHAPYLSRESSVEQAKRRKSVSKAEDKTKKFIETMQNLAKIGVFVYDIHGENVMSDENGDWKITDIGVSEVSCPMLMDVL